MKSTAGARFLAREKDLSEGRVVEAVDYPTLGPPRGPIVERLSIASLNEVAKLFGWTMGEIVQRYEIAR